MNAFYAEDLAYVHHVGFSDFANHAGAEMLKLFSDAGIAAGLVIDLGCGSGIWARKLIHNGFNVLGIDMSEPMVHLARQNAPVAEFHCSSIYEAALRPCAAVTALGEVLNSQLQLTH